MRFEISKELKKYGHQVIFVVSVGSYFEISSFIKDSQNIMKAHNNMSSLNVFNYFSGEKA